MHLYRHFNSAGELLYVGVSLSALNRLGQHKDHSAWYKTISSVTLEEFESRDAALQAEREAIANEKPRHNLVHKRRHQQNKSRADDSRSTLTGRVVDFKPIYSLLDAQRALSIGPTALRQLIDRKKIGYVIMDERQQGERTIKKLGITGWQMIEFLEYLEMERNGKQ
jgi:predicted GIY-YIG superfamily endonuclease